MGHTFKGRRIGSGGKRERKGKKKRRTGKGKGKMKKKGREGKAVWICCLQNNF